jgi:hypothetical protein
VAAVALSIRAIGVNGVNLKYTKFRLHRFSADGASEVNLSNRISVLGTDILETVHQTSGFF